MEKIKNKAIAIFDKEPVRRIWDDEEELWYFSIVDVVSILTKSRDAKDYWYKMKIRVKKEDGAELSTNCRQLKFMAKDGKYYKTDAANVENLLRIIQSIPSPKAEPFKLWLARVGYERLRETTDPEIAINRARENWQVLGHSDKWIEQRMRGQEIRNKLTDYWANHQVTAQEEFATLTNLIHKEWSGVDIKDHKKLKNLRGHNLRDNMTEAELIFTSLAELSTRNVAEKDLATGLQENSIAAIKGGRFAGKARKDFEKLTGNNVVSKSNFLPPNKKTIQ